MSTRAARKWSAAAVHDGHPRARRDVHRLRTSAGDDGRWVTRRRRLYARRAVRRARALVLRPLLIVRRCAVGSAASPEIPAAVSAHEEIFAAAATIRAQ